MQIQDRRPPLESASPWSPAATCCDRCGGQVSVLFFPGSAELLCQACLPRHTAAFPPIVLETK